MGASIHGGIEFRHPGHDSDWYEGEPWLPAMDLYPLYDERDYHAWGCLFGVRNVAGFRPVAEKRGLPADVSSQLRTGMRGMEWLSWVSWSELDALDLSGTPDGCVGRLRWRSQDAARVGTYQTEVRADGSLASHGGAVPADWHPGIEHMEWDADGSHFEYQRLTAGLVLGAETDWPHVFAVMRALAGRFGGDGVRLVVGFSSV